MRLSKVSYHVFEHEVERSWADAPDAWHQLDGQVVLEFEDAGPVFVSWGSEPEQYCIAQLSTSFFVDSALRLVAMSQHAFWNPMMGRIVDLTFVDDRCQVLKVSDGQSALFLSSQYDDGSFFGDAVRVSRSRPL
jgi:hypothetical protein